MLLLVIESHSIDPFAGVRIEAAACSASLHEFDRLKDCGACYWEMKMPGVAKWVAEYRPIKVQLTRAPKPLLKPERNSIRDISQSCRMAHDVKSPLRAGIFR